MKKIEIGDIITIQFDNGTTSKIICIDIDKSSYLEDDYWFNYCDDETNRPLIHPDLGKKPMIKGHLCFTEPMLLKIIKEDESTLSKLDAYIKRKSYEYVDESSYISIANSLSSLYKRKGLSDEQIIEELEK